MAGEFTFRLDPTCAGRSLASCVKRLMPELSWSQLKRLIFRRRVRVNGQVCADPGRSVVSGDVLRIGSLPTRRKTPPFSVVYRDEHLIIVEKPPRMLTTLRVEDLPTGENATPTRPKTAVLDESVDRWLAQNAPSGGELPALRTRIVHRLDRDTSGLMLFALTDEAQERLRHLFARHEVARTYLAVVLGVIDQAMTIESYLVSNRGDGLRGSSVHTTREAAFAADPTARRAITHVQPIEHLQDRRYTLVRCRLETGRTHQIRIHLSEAGHRLCGEGRYTHAIHEQPQPDATGAPRQALHSAELTFVHPITGQVLQFAAALPPDLSNWLKSVRA